MAQFNENIKIAAPNPIDYKYMSTRTSAGRQLPYSGTSEVTTTIPIFERHIGLTVNVENDEWWFETGVTDTDLIPKFIISDFDGITGATNLGYYDGTSTYQRLNISVNDKIDGGLQPITYTDYFGIYESAYGYYYRDASGRIIVGAPPSDNILRRPYIKNSEPKKSLIWNEEVNSPNALLGWALVDGDVQLMVGDFARNIEYYEPDIVAYTGATILSGITYPLTSLSINSVTEVVPVDDVVFNQAPVYAQNSLDGTRLELRTLRSITPNTLNVTYDKTFINIGTVANNYITDAKNGLYVTGISKIINSSEYIVRLGGALTEHTRITIPTGTSLSFVDNRATTSGITYYGDYETGFQPRTLVTKQYVDNIITGGTLIKSVCILPTSCQSYTVKNGDFFIGARTDNIVGINTFQTVVLPDPTTSPQGMVVIVSDYDGFAGVEDGVCCIQISGIIFGGVSDIETKHGSLSYINNGCYWSIIGFSPTP